MLARSFLALLIILFGLTRPAQAEPVTTFLAAVGTYLTAGALQGTAAAVFAAAAITATTVALAAALLIKTPSTGQQGSTIPSVGAGEAFRHCVGRTLVAGHVARRHSQDDSNKWFCEGRALVYGPIHQFVEIRINDYTLSFMSLVNGPAGIAPLNPPKATLVEAGLPKSLNDAIYFELYRGEADEPVGQMLQTWGGAKNTAFHPPFATLAFRVRAKPWELRMPTVTAVIDGHRIYDPRDPSQDAEEPSTWGFEVNPALIAAWYVRQSWAFAARSDEIDWQSVITAANICDEMVVTHDGVTLEARYRMGGQIFEDDDRERVIADICLAMAGWYVEPKVMGKWQFFAGAYQTPELDILPEDIGSGNYRPAARDARSRFTIVRGRFQDAASSYQENSYPEVVIYPALAREAPEFQAWLDANPEATDAQKREEALTYRHLVRTLDLTYVQSSTQAQRVAHIIGMQAYYQQEWDGELGGIGLLVQPGHNVTLTDSMWSIDQMVARVIGVEEKDEETRVSLQEDHPDIYLAPDLQPPTVSVAPKLPTPDDPNDVDTPGGGGGVDFAEAV